MLVNVQNASVYYKAEGSGLPSLFLHGVPDTAEMWDGIIASMKAHYRCIAPDLPGLGRSSAPANFDYSLESMTRFVDDLLNALDLGEPINLIITNFGAVFGLAWAAQNPERVRRIVLVGSVNFFPDYQWHSQAKLWRTPLVGEMMMAVTNRSNFANRLSKTVPALSKDYWSDVYNLSMAKPSVKRAILRMYRAIDPPAFAAWQERLAALTRRVPMLILWGDQDIFISKDYAERFGAHEVQHYPQYGHWIAVEASNEMAQQIIGFFA